MPDLNAPEARIPDAMESMRLLFDGSGAMRGRMTGQMVELAAAQKQILREWEDMTHGWFARRQNGAQAALDAAQELSRCSDPAEALNACQRWIAGSMSRMATDALEAQNHGARMMKAATEALRSGLEAPVPGAPPRPRATPPAKREGA
jgi:hypothetical protein